MALPLENEINRLKVTLEIMRWLRWKAAKTGKSHPEIAREALQLVALREMEDCLHDARLLKGFMEGEGQISDAIGTNPTHNNVLRCK